MDCKHKKTAKISTSELGLWVTCADCGTTKLIAAGGEMNDVYPFGKRVLCVFKLMREGLELYAIIEMVGEELPRILHTSLCKDMAQTKLRAMAGKARGGRE